MKAPAEKVGKLITGILDRLQDGRQSSYKVESDDHMIHLDLTYYARPVNAGINHKRFEVGICMDLDTFLTEGNDKQSEMSAFFMQWSAAEKEAIKVLDLDPEPAKAAE